MLRECRGWKESRRAVSQAPDENEVENREKKMEKIIKEELVGQEGKLKGCGWVEKRAAWVKTEQTDETKGKIGQKKDKTKYI